MGLENLAACGSILLVLIVTWAYFGVAIVRRGRQFRSLQRDFTSVAAVQPDSVVVVAGTVVGPTIASPLAQTACVYWRVKVKKLRSSSTASNRYRTNWHTIFEQASTTPFDVSDATGVLTVVPERANTSMLRHPRRFDDFGGLTEMRLAQLQGLGMRAPRRGLLGKAQSYSIEELQLLPGDTVVAIGYADRTNTNGIALRTHSRQRLFLINEELGAARASVRLSLLVSAIVLPLFTIVLCIVLFSVMQ